MLAQLHSAMSAIISIEAQGEDQGKQDNKCQSGWERETLGDLFTAWAFKGSQLQSLVTDSDQAWKK